MKRKSVILLTASAILFAVACFALTASAAQVAEGAAFPHFTVPDIGGTVINTKQYAQGKALLLDFWSIYCTSCLQEMPYIVEIYNKYKDKGLTALSIDMDAFGTRRVLKFIESLDFKIPYPTIIDEKRTIGNLLGVSMLPTVMLVDPSGKVTLFHVGYRPGFEKELDTLVQGILPKAK